ncbi:MAG: tRNA-dihydrouridine synthase family protein, partial [Muribaculaceae bacterium]|nr:tRNA-dihydrouridine synthase family protein [Muribaculaceae bacterium]
MKLFAAPLQGYTDAPFRHWHAALYGGVDTYFTPFLRVEKQAPASKALRDITSPLNANHPLVPQIIFNGADEFRLLVDTLVELGHRRVDLNIGCPFPPQVHRGRGAGFIACPDRWPSLQAAMACYPHVGFSVKMRLGVGQPDEWLAIAPMLNDMPLTSVTLHPRTARQQYRGDLCLDHLDRFIDTVRHPIIFNGDITTPSQYAAIASRYPRLDGVMIGRGLLGRPSLCAEISENREWSPEERLHRLIGLHDHLFDHYSATLCGDTQ